MSFKTHRPAPAKAHPETAPITVTLARMGRAQQSAMFIKLRSAFVSEVGFTENQAIEVAIGEGEHHGLIRLRPAPEGVASIPLRKMKAGGHSGIAVGESYRLSLGHCPQFTNVPQKQRAVAFEVLDGDDAGWIELVLPAWADETDPRRRQPPPERAGATACAEQPAGACAGRASPLDERRRVTCAS